MSSTGCFIVTGGAGFIGSAVVEHLLAATRYRICVIDNLTYAANLASLAPFMDNPRFTFVRADITDAAAVANAVARVRPSVIMHLAAESHVDRGIEQPLQFIETNIVGTYVLLQAALEYWRDLPVSERRTFRLHHVSTDEVYGSLGETGLFSELSPYRPNSPYSASKAASDHLVRAWGHTYGLPVVVSNCSNNFGPRQFPEKLVPLTILNALERKPIPVYGDGGNTRDWLFVNDHARALVLIAQQGQVGQTYNVGGACERRNVEVVRLVCDLMDRVSPAEAPHDRLITFVPDRPGHDRRYAIDATKLSRDLGWAPIESFESGMAKTVAWYLENRSWWEPIRRSRYRGERLGLVVGRSGPAI
jgi:dTDP-glucose 4,6-dehydratase